MSEIALEFTTRINICGVQIAIELHIRIFVKCAGEERSKTRLLNYIGAIRAEYQL